MTMKTVLKATLASMTLTMGIGAALVAGSSRPALAQSGYQLQPGDVLQVEVLEDPSLNRSVIVLPDGSISVPQAGTLRAGGRTIDQVRAAITQALAPNFTSPPNVYVTVGSLAVPPGAAAQQQARVQETVPLYVMGEVSAPGLKEALPGTNILQLLAQAGSLTRFAARGRIELHRLDPQTKVARVYLFDLDRAGGGPDRISGMTTLATGDILIVPTRRLFE